MRRDALATGLCRGMADTPVVTDLGGFTVTGGSGFLGASLVSELLNYEHWVRCFDRLGSPLPAPPAGVGVAGRWGGSGMAEKIPSGSNRFFAARSRGPLGPYACAICSWSVGPSMLG